ncbi:MAG: hypothetical protein AAF862_06285 [Pseudomonadota bacterium]
MTQTIELKTALESAQSSPDALEHVAARWRDVLAFIDLYGVFRLTTPIQAPVQPDAPPGRAPDTATPAGPKRALTPRR